MQRLIDPAVMIVAMIVPTLHSQGLEKRLHNSSPCCHRVSTLWRFDESDVTGASIGGEEALLAANREGQTAARAAGFSAGAGLVPPALEKRISGKGPDGGVCPRATPRTPRERLAQSA